MSVRDKQVRGYEYETNSNRYIRLWQSGQRSGAFHPSKSRHEAGGVFTRREPSQVTLVDPAVPVYPLDQLEAMADAIDVLIMCGGSATDLPVQTPKYAKLFHVVDSFDTHANIPEHFAKVDQSAKEGGKVAMISIGWDPGLFSLNRVMAEAILPQGNHYTFWGKGVSQGHSDAIRRIDGVLDGKQYTIPVEEALEAVRSGSNPSLTTRQKHRRECFVVAEEGADQARIEQEIKNMPKYFSDYEHHGTLYFPRGIEEKSQRHSPWRPGDSHWKNRRERGAYPCGRIFHPSGFQPGIYRQRFGGLCPRGLSVGSRASGWRQNHL